MGRHARTQHRERKILDHFDTEYREWPQLPHIATITAMPMKTRYINIACSPTANIDKVIFDVDEMQAYFPEYFNW